MVHNNRTTTFTVSEAFKEDQQGEGIPGGGPPPPPPPPTFPSTQIKQKQEQGLNKSIW